MKHGDCPFSAARCGAALKLQVTALSPHARVMEALSCAEGMSPCKSHDTAKYRAQVRQRTLGILHRATHASFHNLQVAFLMPWRRGHQENAGKNGNGQGPSQALSAMAAEPVLSKADSRERPSGLHDTQTLLLRVGCVQESCCAVMKGCLLRSR